MHAHKNPFGGIAFYDLDFYNFAGRLWSGVHFGDNGRGEEGWENLDFKEKMDWEVVSVKAGELPWSHGGSSPPRGTLLFRLERMVLKRQLSGLYCMRLYAFIWQGRRFSWLEEHARNPTWLKIAALRKRDRGLSQGCIRQLILYLLE